MEWGTLGVAATGALFGIGATLITDVFRSRRERDQRWADAKRAAYARFLTALAQAHSRMTVAAARGEAGPARRQAIHDAFLSDPQYSDAKSVLREVALAAPDHVHQAAESVYEQLRAARDILAEDGMDFASPQYQQAIRPFFANLDALQRLMRDDLQPPAERRV